MNGMVLHSGGVQVSLDDLKNIPMPEETETYIPVGHYDLAMNINKVADDLLVPKGYAFIDAKYATAREGQRVFGMFRYKNGCEDIGFAIGWRNSYDKSMSAALAIGANVFVCDNLAINGDITIMRRHTKNVQADLISSIVNALYNCTNQYEQFQALVERMKTIELPERRGHELLGRLIGERMLTPDLFNVAMREWRNPSHEAFEPRNVWSFYNAITESLKAAPPHRIFEMHREVHKSIVAEFEMVA